MTEIFRPNVDVLPGYRDALLRGWSPNNVSPERTAKAHLAAIEENPDGFVAGLEDLEAKGPPVVLPDGREVRRLPGFARWIWQDGFCGALSFRFQPGTSVLPPHVLGHIGYAIVPWRRREGHATRGLGLLLAEIAPFGLPHVEITVDPDNLASVRVIEANGGQVDAHFELDPSYGGGIQVRYRIPLDATAHLPQAVEFRRHSDGLVYRFERQSNGGFRRTDGEVVLIKHPKWGWIVAPNAGDEVLSRPWYALPEDQTETPPAGIWVSRKGAKSYVYDLVHQAAT